MFAAQLPYQMKYTIWLPVKTGPLWYAIDLSVLVGLLAAALLAVSVLNALCATACPPSDASASILTSPMSFDFMAVLLLVLVKGYHSRQAAVCWRRACGSLTDLRMRLCPPCDGSAGHAAVALLAVHPVLLKQVMAIAELDV